MSLQSKQWHCRWNHKDHPVPTLWAWRPRQRSTQISQKKWILSLSQRRFTILTLWIHSIPLRQINKMKCLQSGKRSMMIIIRHTTGLLRCIKTNAYQTFSELCGLQLYLHVANLGWWVLIWNVILLIYFKLDWNKHHLENLKMYISGILSILCKSGRK